MKKTGVYKCINDMTLEDEQLINKIIKEERMEDKKLQWSKFSPDRSEQYVIRNDDEKEFDTLVVKYKAKLPQKAAFPDDEGPSAVKEADVQPSAPVCPINPGHGPMKYRSGTSAKTGKPYAFWSCSQKNPDNTWCGGKK